MVEPRTSSRVSHQGCCSQSPMLQAFVRPKPNCHVGRFLHGDGLELTGFQLECSLLRWGWQRRRTARQCGRNRAMRRPVGRQLLSSARGSRSIAGKNCISKLSMAWPFTGGDMVLGSVKDVAAGHERQRSTKASTGAWPERRDLAAVEDEFLWPDGIIPFVIEPGFTEKGLRDIKEAIRA